MQLSLSREVWYVYDIRREFKSLKCLCMEYGILGTSALGDLMIIENMRWITWESEAFPPNLCSLPVDKIYCLRRRLGAKRHVAVGNILDNIYRQYT